MSCRLQRLFRLSYLGIAAPLLLCASTMAQDKVERTYEIHFIGPITDAAEKYLIEGLVAQDPSIQWWVDRPTQSALARTYATLDQATLQSYIAPAGMLIGYMGELLTGPFGATERIGASDFPEYTDTGDPSSDAAAFLAAKTAWFASHPTSVAPVTVK